MRNQRKNRPLRMRHGGGGSLVGAQRRLRRLLRLRRDDRATATLEFALVFPVLLFLILVLAQTTLLMGGNVFVHYAAFAATRSAVVQVPRDLAPGEPANTIFWTDGSPKYEAVRRAAVFAVVPVSGRLTQAGTSTDAFVEGLSQFYAAHDVNQPAWVEKLMADRLRYADAHTTVQLLETTVEGEEVVFEPIGSGGVHTFGPKDPVTVRVSHRVHLSVPYVGAIFADGASDTPTGRSRYSLVTAQYTLTNEGIARTLPPTPPIPRDP